MGGGRQAGYGVNPDGNFRAVVWTGTAASAADLHAVAVAGLTVNGAPPVHSLAYGVDSAGNIAGEVRDAAGKSYAVLWKPR